MAYLLEVEVTTADLSGILLEFKALVVDRVFDRCYYTNTETKEQEMTVAELIRILQTLDPTEEVRVSHPYLDDSAPLEDVVLVGPARNIPILSAHF